MKPGATSESATRYTVRSQLSLRVTIQWLTSQNWSQYGTDSQQSQCWCGRQEQQGIFTQTVHLLRIRPANMRYTYVNGKATFSCKLVFRMSCDEHFRCQAAST